ncbi:hypothetical protein llap_8137 [Limosa lapponica baueri]|uniref:Uncharacterized protein n=1 Tax=Limosa lapponica baueri TaxID=1758121 RepID=A0A2I0U6B4_LIMLA|nr:hypothetical protein llap_8137 [Limosa lapponica baueri]
MEVNGGAEVHLQPMEDHMPEQVDAKGGCEPLGSLRWSRLLWREKPTLEQCEKEGYKNHQYFNYKESTEKQYRYRVYL